MCIPLPSAFLHMQCQPDSERYKREYPRFIYLQRDFEKSDPAT